VRACIKRLRMASASMKVRGFIGEGIADFNTMP
jgi:hypothetical protein